MADPVLLSTLRDPPKVGRHYLVPCVECTYFDRLDWWPTFGPLHHDKGDVGFDLVHLHVDPRFLSGRQAQYLRRQRGSVERVVAGHPLARLGDNPPNRPVLKLLRCRVSSWTYDPPGVPRWIGKLEARFGAPAEAILLSDGRLLCPHRKADLSSLPCGDDGVVTCPLHALRVRVRDAEA